MEWTEEGIILGTRRHGETSVILELFTLDKGRHLGLVRGGRSRRLQPVLQPANSVTATWRARLDEHLGVFSIEPSLSRAASLMESSQALYGFALLSAHLRLLPERDPHPLLYHRLIGTLDMLADMPMGAAALARFELALLAELGFGLDLSECAATGRRQELAFVSPKSGRAVCREAGAPYKDRLLPLPSFLRLDEDEAADAAAILDAFALTGYFLDRHVLEPRRLAMPPERQRIITSIEGLANPRRMA